MPEIPKDGLKEGDVKGVRQMDVKDASSILATWKHQTATAEAKLKAKELTDLAADLDPCEEWQCATDCEECPATRGFPELCAHLLDLARTRELGECDTCVEKDNGLCRMILSFIHYRRDGGPDGVLASESPPAIHSMPLAEV